jgi:hypothetical protein
MKTDSKLYVYSLIGLSILAVGGIAAFFVFRKKSNDGSGNTNNDNNNTNPLFEMSKTLVCTHIANIDTAGSSPAQNNLRNIGLNLNNDISIIEMDIQITKDNVPVLFHDNTLDARTNGSGTIQSKTWAEISQLRYDNDSSAGIAKLADAIALLKQSGKPTIFQLDKCDNSEIAKINSLGLFKGVENQMLAKSTSFTIPSSVKAAGIMYMPIIPSMYVGKMNSMQVIDEIVEKCKGSQFLEAQFSDADTLFIDGTLAKKLDAIGCKLLVVAVGGSSTTNGRSFRGDSKTQWSKMVAPMGAGAIMTNRPIQLKNYLATIQ